MIKNKMDKSYLFHLNQNNLIYITVAIKIVILNHQVNFSACYNNFPIRPITENIAEKRITVNLGYSLTSLY